mmetsp:Transcript_72746/g.194135  ORF Transcript_72746/g.194135 Transcript_72746/m.194135 type:complete len:233 (-) Transcript_72746:225-923(-)
MAISDLLGSFRSHPGPELEGPPALDHGPRRGYPRPREGVAIALRPRAGRQLFKQRGVEERIHVRLLVLVAPRLPVLHPVGLVHPGGEVVEHLGDIPHLGNDDILGDVVAPIRRPLPVPEDRDMQRNVHVQNDQPIPEFLRQCHPVLEPLGVGPGCIQVQRHPLSAEVFKIRNTLTDAPPVNLLVNSRPHLGGPVSMSALDLIRIHAFQFQILMQHELSLHGGLSGSRQPHQK